MLAPVDNTTAFDVDQFLAGEHQKDLLRFTTAGSVDDGKSTLIGRLLYDSQNVYEDQIKAIAKSTINRSAGVIDLSLLTDGLRAEREQGITIDVAYRYFSTARRKFIIADTPGHEQYTRNMATGASTADLAIILIDARNGVQVQSRRHAYIASLLGIPKFVIAINKMDLVGFSQDVFDAIRNEFTGVLNTLDAPDAYFVPLSALTGDNVVKRSNSMPWFDGPSLLEFLETVELEGHDESAAFRFPVQRVIRPDQNFRGYAGQVVGGSIRPGDPITVYPSGRTTKVKSIETFDGPLTRAFAPMSVTLTLEDEVDISRGDLLSSGDNPPLLTRAFEAQLVWMSEQPLDPQRTYLLKHASETVPARITKIDYRIDMRTLERQEASALHVNAIAFVRIETTRPISFDPYRQNRFTGSAILIDTASNGTVAALMIQRGLESPRVAGPVTAAERAARFGHVGSAIRIGPRPELAKLLERRLFDRGSIPVILNGDLAAEAIKAAGLLAIVVSSDSDFALEADDEMAAARVISWLEEKRILVTERAICDGEGI